MKEMIIAATEGDLDTVKSFIANGADVNAKCPGNGATSLIAAAQGGQLHVVRLLLEQGANVNAKDNDGETALAAATVGGHTKIVEVLIQAGATAKLGEELIASAAKGDLATVQSRISQGVDVNAKNNRGATALMLACMGGYFEVARALINAGANVDAKDWENEATALLLACLESQENIAKLLLEAGANVHVQVKNRDWTPLYVAASIGNINLVRMLLDAGAGDNAEFKNSAALAAVSQGHKEIGRLILDPERKGKPFYEFLRDAAGQVIGIWVADLNHPNLQARIEILIASEKDKSISIKQFAAFREGRYRTIPNTTDNRGGTFLMFDVYVPSNGSQRQ